MRRDLMSLAAAAVLASGCHHVTYRMGNVRPALRPNDEQWHHNLVLGLIEYQKTDLDKECPGGFAVVDHQENVVDVVVHLLVDFIPTVGWLASALWSPSHVQVTCSAQPTPNVAPPSGGPPPYPATPPPIAVPPPPPPAAPGP